VFTECSEALGVTEEEGGPLPSVNILLYVFLALIVHEYPLLKLMIGFMSTYVFPNII
jgi:hypothetical protein